MPSPKPFLHVSWEDIYVASLEMSKAKTGMPPTRSDILAIFDRFCEEDVDCGSDSFWNFIADMVQYHYNGKYP